MDIRSYIDSTYLKTLSQSGLNEEQNQEVVTTLVEEAIRESFKLVMIRPEMVSLAKQMIVNAASNVKVGTVIDFPEGNATIEAKIKRGCSGYCRRC